jgi:hypothetical protein
MTSHPSALAACLTVVFAACAPSAYPHTQPTPPSTMTVATNTSRSPKELATETPLESGFVAFQGMARPTKGGYQVHGAIIELFDVGRAERVR